MCEWGTNALKGWPCIPQPRRHTASTLTRRRWTPFGARLAAYDEMRPELEAEHLGKWVIVRNRELVDIYETFETQPRPPLPGLARGPYHIREVGDKRVFQLPPALAFGLL